MHVKYLNTKNKDKGFTLVELLAVLIVMGIIALLVVPNISKTISNSEESAMNKSLESLVSAADNYYNMNVFEVPPYGSPLEFKDINLLVKEGYASNIPDNTQGIFFLVYTSHDVYRKEVILSSGNKYYSSIKNLEFNCSLYQDLCSTNYKSYYEKECVCP